MKAFINLSNSLAVHFIYLFCIFLLLGGVEKKVSLLLLSGWHTNSSYEVIYINHWKKYLAPLGT